jgi:hypothetical protein
MGSRDAGAGADDVRAVCRTAELESAQRDLSGFAGVGFRARVPMPPLDAGLLVAMVV